MIVKNYIVDSFLELEARDTECTTYQADSSDLNMKLGTGVISSPLFQECRFSLWSKDHNVDENRGLSSLSHQSLHKDKPLDTVNMKFVEKFSELKLENPVERKLDSKRKDNILKATSIASVENHIDQKLLAPDSGSSSTSYESLPTAKISIKENDKKPFCLSCNDDACSSKSKLNKNENITTQCFNPFIRSLVPRSPERNGRIHCKVSQTHTIGKSKTAGCVSGTKTFNFHGNSSSADFCSQLLHGNGGCFSEVNSSVNEEIKNMCRFDQQISLEQIGNSTNLFDQFSPSSVSSTSSSASSSSSPSSVDYLSPSSMSNNIDSYSVDTRNPSPNISDLYPTPPSSVLQNASLQTNDYFSESSPEHSSLQSNVNDDSLVEFPSFDGNLSSSDVSSPSSEKCDTFSSSSTQDKLNDIVWFLKNGSVDPLIAQSVNRCSQISDDATDKNHFRQDSASINSKGDKITQKLNTLPCSPTSNHTISSPQLPSHTMPPICNSGNGLVHPTLLLMLFQSQTATVPGQKDRLCQREIKPNILPTEKGVDLPKNNERYHDVKNTSSRLNSGNVKHKSVKAKIRDSITCEEKKILLKSALEERTTSGGSTKLHSAVMSRNEKLVYVIIESRRTFIKSENLNSKTDNLHPRISTAVKIETFVNEQDDLGCTALYYAAFTENSLMVAYLLECGASPFIADNTNGNTPYHIATLRGDDAIKLMELLSFERNVTDVTNKKGQTILMAAVINHGRMYHGVQINGLKLIKYLLCNDHTLSPQDSEGRTALHIAAMKKDVKLLEVLLTYGTDAEKAKLIKDKEGNTILHNAALMANYRLIETTMTHCSKLTEITNNNGKLPYELINENRPERELLRKKFDEYGFRNL